jgi:putative ABC transport system permease protein
VLGLFWFDALAYMIDMTFDRIQRGDGQLTLNEAVPEAAAAGLAGLEGVMLAEGQRVVPVRLRSGHRAHRTAITGLPPQGELNVPRSRDYARVAVPEDGILLSRRLAGRLDLSLGDQLTVEVLQGSRPVREVRLAAVSDDVLGLTATMSLTSLNALMREGPLINAVALRTDPALHPSLFRRLSGTPAIATTSLKSVWLELFQDRVVGLIRISAVALTIFGGLIVVGVVYNTARVSFHERATELASLRILGFTRGEAARVLLTELAVVVTLGIALGAVLSGWVVRLLLAARSTESFDIPPIIAPATFAISALTILGASLASAWVIRRRIDGLDLVGVLKARE